MNYIRRDAVSFGVHVLEPRNQLSQLIRVILLIDLSIYLFKLLLLHYVPARHIQKL